MLIPYTSQHTHSNQAVRSTPANSWSHSCFAALLCQQAFQSRIPSCQPIPQAQVESISPPMRSHQTQSAAIQLRSKVSQESPLALLHYSCWKLQNPIYMFLKTEIALPQCKMFLLLFCCAVQSLLYSSFFLLSLVTAICCHQTRQSS